ncbi:ROK family transcriptional regulator [Sphingomonas montanisoli]|uniref:ROK family transcriptional regulator n=1 Tax=Sphingomonas montanisoli TaxID=2606412 RepID=A0A5D9C6S4_9SPHN|nr:ROK family transcriptional regulator [Sphingomonas montanisoli]TZG25695.1 ROK family transcriptional regulator [Sphingomonas montanisoli]
MSENGPSFAKLMNSERGVLDALFRAGSTTQGDLVNAFDLTQQSISRIVGGLADRQMVAAGRKVSGAKGYRTSALKLVGDFAHSIGVSITAGTASLVVMNFAGEVVARRKAHPRTMGVENVAVWIEGEMRGDLGEDVRRGAFVGLGISIAGSFIDARSFNTPSYLEEWAGIDVEEVLRTRMGCAVFAENDGNAATLAEGILGVGRWAPSFAYLYLSSGVGGGLMLNGDLWRGRYGNAGEFAGGLPPNIYPFPNLELLRVLAARDGINFETVDELVSNYDPAWLAIDEWISRVHDSVSIIVSNATAILDLDAIVLGGLIPTDLAQRLAAKVEMFDQRRRSVARPIARLVPAEVLSDAAAIGAAMLPLRATFFTPQGVRTPIAAARGAGAEQ